MDLLMFYGLACLSFLRISFLCIMIVIDVFFIDSYRNYQNIDVVFVSDNIVSILFSRQRSKTESDLAFYWSFPIVFIPSQGAIDESKINFTQREKHLKQRTKTHCVNTKQITTKDTTNQNMLIYSGIKMEYQEHHS